jgi:hypothetical protein
MPKQTTGTLQRHGDSKGNHLQFPGFTVGVSTTGMVFPDSITFDDWKTVGGYFLAARVTGESLQWSLCDWLEFGARQFCETDPETLKLIPDDKFSKYQHVAEATGYAPDSLRVYASIGRSVPKRIRRTPDVLSFSHHMVVAPIQDPIQQDELLQKAVDEGLSVSELRVHVRRLIGDAAGDDDLPGIGAPNILSFTSSIERAFSRLEQKRPLNEWPPMQRAAIKQDLSAHIAKVQAICARL